MNISKENFDVAFKRMQANFRIEGIDIKDEDKELYYKRLIGEITESEYFEMLGVKRNER